MPYLTRIVPAETSSQVGGHANVKSIGLLQAWKNIDVAADLSRFRESIGEQIEALEAQQIAEAIDQLRAGDQQQQQVPEAPIALDTSGYSRSRKSIKLPATMRLPKPYRTRRCWRPCRSKSSNMPAPQNRLV